jgi:hypothetical protein
LSTVESNGLLITVVTGTTTGLCDLLRLRLIEQGREREEKEAEVAVPSMRRLPKMNEVWRPVSVEHNSEGCRVKGKSLTG